jgi:hypothetical protein
MGLNVVVETTWRPRKRKQMQGGAREKRTIVCYCCRAHPAIQATYPPDVAIVTEEIRSSRKISLANIEHGVGGRASQTRQCARAHPRTPGHIVPSTVVLVVMDEYTTLSCVVSARAGTSADAEGPTIPAVDADEANVVRGVSVAALAAQTTNSTIAISITKYTHKAPLYCQPTSLCECDLRLQNSTAFRSRSGHRFGGVSGTCYFPLCLMVSSLPVISSSSSWQAGTETQRAMTTDATLLESKWIPAVPFTSTSLALLRRDFFNFCLSTAPLTHPRHSSPTQTQTQTRTRTRTRS